MSISAFTNKTALIIYLCISTIATLTGLVVPNGATMLYIAMICFNVISINLWLFDIAISLRKLNNRDLTIKD